MIYNLIIYLYLLGVAIYSRFNEKVRKMWQGEREAFKILREKVDPNAKYVWFHAASLGEFEQGRPLMEQLRKDHPESLLLAMRCARTTKVLISSLICRSTPSLTLAVSCVPSTL